ncbi:MAG: haloacid dehalogenase type II [Candidatus Dormibacteraeota bacterium]|nr:haloacid dehalogenase type II [Candidatus Dormibacteraeota bacterium]
MIIAFDLNGTLTDPRGIGDPWGTPELGLVVLQTAVNSAGVDALLDRYRPFAEQLRAALGLRVQQRGLDPGGIDAAMARAARLDPFEDTASCLEQLDRAGHRLVVLTNSGAEAGRATLEAAGLAGHFEQILGVDAVRSVKPHPRTYAYLLRQLEVAPDQVTVVAAHWWDVTGAKHAGMRTVWIARGEGFLSGSALEPDHRVPDLAGVARLFG